MRIISSFKDRAIDGFMRNGMSNIIWKRETKREEEYPLAKVKLSTTYNIFTTFNFNRENGAAQDIVCIGYCGKVQHYIYTASKGEDPPRVELITASTSLPIYIEKSKLLERVDNSLFEDYDAPIWIFHPWIYPTKTLEVNPCLTPGKMQPYQFPWFSFWEPAQIFQDVENYIGTHLLNPPNAMVEVSDNTKITKHGFDTKVSFRGKLPRRPKSA